LLFFDATLKQQAAAREALRQCVRGRGLDDGFKLTFKPATPAPPTHAQLASFLKEHRVEKTVELIQSIPGQPTSQVASAAFVLLKDHEPKAALPALQYATKEYPKVASYQVWLGQTLGLTGDRKGAMAAYRKAAELLPDDGTDDAWRRNNKYLIEKGLKELETSELPPRDR
jgi:tetratricopeptide (TPR) repeat protein